MIAGEFDSISKNDIDALVAAGEPERRTMEYKLELPPGNDEGTREFLADVSSLANTAGGNLVFGIRDKKGADGKPTGVPETAEGLAITNPDTTVQRLANILRDGLDPRIPGVQIKPVEGFLSGPIIVLRVPKSWVAPHMVKFKGSSRFFTRASNGKHQMDVREIRTAFAGSESIATKISAFRSDRIAKILADETPVKLGVLPKIALHFLPLRSFSEPEPLDIKALFNTWDQKLRPMGIVEQYSAPRFNLHGLFVSGHGSLDPTQQRLPTAYMQLFRNGAFESVYRPRTHEKRLLGANLEGPLMTGGLRYVEFLDRLDLGAMFVALSVVSIKGFEILDTFNPMNSRWHQIAPIEDDVLLAPELLSEQKGADLGSLLRPAFDTIWQASGWPGSMGYNEHGKWEGYSR